MLMCFATTVLLIVVQGWKTPSDSASPTTSGSVPNSVPNSVSNSTSDLAADSVILTEATPTAITPLPSEPETLPVPPSQLLVDLSERVVYFYQNQGLLAIHKIAVGKPGWETPTGSYKVINLQVNPVWRHPQTGEIVPSGPDNPLGSRWIGFWTDGKSQIGFHGTNEPDLLGQAVSHGCIRMRDTEIQVLYTQVTLGTPVTVQP